MCNLPFIGAANMVSAYMVSAALKPLVAPLLPAAERQEQQTRCRDQHHDRDSREGLGVHFASTTFHGPEMGKLKWVSSFTCFMFVTTICSIPDF